jgi:hypothetical protein
MKFNNNGFINFLIIFCITYTFLDITDSVVSLLNKSNGGILASKPAFEQFHSNSNTNSSFVITVNVEPKK